MTRLHFVKKSRKEQKDTTTGQMIPVGSSYYWWQFAFGRKNISLTQPKPQQLTQSAYDSTIMDIQDALGELTTDDLESQVGDITSQIEELKSDCEDKLSNMPENLQESSSSGQLLQERIDALESWLSDIQGVDLSVDEDEIREEVTEEFKNELEEELAPEEEAADGTQVATPEQIAAGLEAKKDEIEQAVQEKVEEKANEIVEEIQGFSPN